MHIIRNICISHSRFWLLQHVLRLSNSYCPMLFALQSFIGALVTPRVFQTIHWHNMILTSRKSEPFQRKQNELHPPKIRELLDMNPGQNLSLAYKDCKKYIVDHTSLKKSLFS